MQVISCGGLGVGGRVAGMGVYTGPLAPISACIGGGCVGDGGGVGCSMHGACSPIPLHTSRFGSHPGTQEGSYIGDLSFEPMQT